MGTYRNFVEEMVTNHLSGKTVRAMLVAETFTLDYDTHTVIGDVSAHEITGAGYSAGGFLVPVTIQTAADEVQIKIPDISITNGDLEMAGIVFYVVETGQLIASEEFPEVVVVEGDFDYKVPTDGILAFLTGA